MIERDKKKTQQYVVNNDFEIEESNAMKRLKLSSNKNDSESSEEVKKVSWIENFWYHYKWVAGIGIVIIVLLIVLVVQLVTYVSPDVSIIYTGTATFNDSRYLSLENSIKEIMDDYNGDGKLKIEYSANTFYSKQQAEERKKNGIFDSSANDEAYNNFKVAIGTGEYLICMLDPTLHETIVDLEGFERLYDVLGYYPDCAYDEYGIILGETDFYKDNASLQFIPPETVVAVRVTSAISINSEEKKQEMQERHIKLFKEIVNYVSKETAE